MKCEVSLSNPPRRAISPPSEDMIPFKRLSPRVMYLSHITPIYHLFLFCKRRMRIRVKWFDSMTIKEELSRVDISHTKTCLPSSRPKAVVSRASRSILHDLGCFALSTMDRSSYGIIVWERCWKRLTSMTDLFGVSISTQRNLSSSLEEMTTRYACGTTTTSARSSR